MAYTAVTNQAIDCQRAGRLFSKIELAQTDVDHKNAKAESMGLKTRYIVGQAEPVNDADRVHTRL